MNNPARKTITAVKIKFRILFLLLTLIIVSVLTGFSQEQSLRSLTTDDLFNLQEIGQVAISPDGEWLAYVIKRSRSSALIQTRLFWKVMTGATSGLFRQREVNRKI